MLKWTAGAVGALLCLAGGSVSTSADDGRPDVERRGVEEVARSAYLLARAPSGVREVWVGLPAPGVPPAELLGALRAAAHDQVAVAVMESGFQPAALTRGRPPASGEQAGEDERAWERILTHAALRDLFRELRLTEAAVRERTRVVLIGFFEGAARAVEVAGHDPARVDDLILVDAPLDRLPQREAGVPGEPGVDLFFHPVGGTQGARDHAEALHRLGPWGATARFFWSTRRLDTLAGCVQEVWDAVRGDRIYSTRAQAPLTRQELAEALTAYDVIFIGELHGNPAAHRLQFEVLRSLAARDRPLALAVEQFERDVQEALDGYLEGSTEEGAFLEASRPWPNYADYRPLIEFCRRQGIPVIASNIPRRLASRIFREGPEVLDHFSEEEKGWSARQLKAEEGPYKEKFLETLQRVEGHNEQLDRMYAAQAVKDDTMAESVAAFLDRRPRCCVLHLNGAFHSAGGLGVPEKLAALKPDLKVAVVTCVEADHPAAQALRAEDARGNDFVVYVPAARPRRSLASPPSP